MLRSRGPCVSSSMGGERKPEGQQACTQDSAVPLRGAAYRPRNPRASPLWQCAQRHGKELREAGGFQRAVEERAKKASLPAGGTLPSPVEEPATEFRSRAKAAWARLIRKVYEIDPLECPKCKGPMRVIALIDDPAVVRRILEHLGLWAPLPTERTPPPAAASWRRHVNLPLTYHPVPDIAWAAVWKRLLRDSQRLGDRLPCSGAGSRLPSNLPLKSAWIAVFSMGEEASMNIRLIMRTPRALALAAHARARRGGFAGGLVLVGGGRRWVF